MECLGNIFDRMRTEKLHREMHAEFEAHVESLVAGIRKLGNRDLDTAACSRVTNSGATIKFLPAWCDHAAWQDSDGARTWSIHFLSGEPQPHVAIPSEAAVQRGRLHPDAVVEIDAEIEFLGQQGWEAAGWLTCQSERRLLHKHDMVHRFGAFYAVLTVEEYPGPPS
jgi:hypothetical protein